MDRLSPIRRPLEPVVMRQEWRHLTFLHWPVPAAAVQMLLPLGLTVDTFDGMAYVGLVPFTMRNVRPVWSPVVNGLSHFHETNVRTYVHFQGKDPGVWFFSLDAANRIAVEIARTVWKLPYYFARMELKREGETLIYRSERLLPPPIPAVCHAHIIPAGSATPATPGTLEHFLAERYILYSETQGRLFKGRVHHAPYPLETARLVQVRETLTHAAGFRLPNDPALVHYAAGVEVEVFPLHPVSSI